MTRERLGDGSSGYRIRRCAMGDDDLAAYVALWAAVTPDQVPDPVEIRWSAQRYPGGARFLVESADGTVVGAATVGRVYMFDASYDGLWADLAVLPAYRRRGFGTALLAACSAHARAAGKVALLAPASDARPEGIAFLEQRGFTVLERAKVVRLDLADLEPPDVAPPPGIRFVTLAERPDLVEAIHAIAVETFPDIPGEPMAVGELDEFRARDVDRPGIVRDGFFVALDREGQAIGYTSLLVDGGRSGVALHDMTAVLPGYRGRGIATALKRAAIGWAIGNGLGALETANDDANAPMRAVNARLGYRPLPDWLLLRGPLFDGIMTP